MCHLFCMEIFGLTDDRHVAEIEFSGLAGESRKLKIYELDVQIAGRTFKGVRVAAGQSDRAILGMNILNKLLITFDGPGDQFQL